MEENGGKRLCALSGRSDAPRRVASNTRDVMALDDLSYLTYWLNMDALSQTFSALADPTRRAILARLADGRRDGGRAGRAVRHVAAGRVAPSQGADRGRPDRAQHRGAMAPLRRCAARACAARGRLDRVLPPLLGAAVRSARRFPQADGARRAGRNRPTASQGETPWPPFLTTIHPAHRRASSTRRATACSRLDRRGASSSSGWPARRHDSIELRDSTSGRRRLATGRRAQQHDAFATSGKYVEIERPDRLVFTWAPGTRRATSPSARPRNDGAPRLRSGRPSTEMIFTQAVVRRTPSGCGSQPTAGPTRSTSSTTILRRSIMTTPSHRFASGMAEGAAGRISPRRRSSRACARSWRRNAARCRG